jgi:anti-sigma factor RsiW
MRDDLFHITDEDLLGVADGELSKRRSRRVRRHLEACWACRARMAEIEGTIQEVARLVRETSDRRLPPIENARACLKAQLADSVQRSHPAPFGRTRFVLNYKGLEYAFALILLLAFGSVFLRRHITEPDDPGQSTAHAATLPNPIITPGATQSVSLASICSSGHDQVVRRVPEGVRQQVFREYGIAGASPADYEVDHLVTPGLGGSDDIRNLWPEPRNSTMWNSYVKDQLEDHLHYLVCSGQLTLAVAQHDIAGNWISAYRKYFHTDAPLLPYSTSG